MLLLCTCVTMPITVLFFNGSLSSIGLNIVRKWNIFKFLYLYLLATDLDEGLTTADNFCYMHDSTFFISFNIYLLLYLVCVSTTHHAVLFFLIFQLTINAIHYLAVLFDIGRLNMHATLVSIQITNRKCWIGQILWKSSRAGGWHPNM